MNIQTYKKQICYNKQQTKLKRGLKMKIQPKEQIQQKEEYKVSQSQLRVLKLFNVEHDENIKYYEAAELLEKNNLPKNGIPRRTDRHGMPTTRMAPIQAKSLSDEKLIELIKKEQSWKESDYIVGQFFNYMASYK